MKSKAIDFLIRHPRTEDATEVTEMVALCDIEEIGEPDISLSDTLDLWNSLHLETDVWVAISPTNNIVGYAFLEVTGESRMDTCVFVHPKFKNQGIGAALLTKVEDRALVLASEREGEQKLMNQIPFTNASARNLVETRGYQFSRLYKRMKTNLTELPKQPNFSAGMVINTFKPDQDEETLFNVFDETFRDSWGYAKKDFSTWIHQKKGEHYDPSLWFIVWEDSKPIAFLMSRMQEDGLFIDLLGVKRSWRKQGVAQAMLLHVFQESYQRGQNTILLYVDSDSLTNAHRVYQQVGMTPDSQTAVYSKVLK
jgi:mycothiol synthase